MKTIKKVVAVFCLVAVVFSCFGVMASAASTKLHSGNKYGGTYGATVKWTATKTGSKTIKTTCTKGKLYTGMYTHKSVYGAYELKIYDDAGNLLTHKDIYDSKTGSITFHAVKGKTYTIKAWFWRASTTVESYLRKGHMTLSPFELKESYGENNYYGFSDSHWAKEYGYPTITISY